jgi:endogenous inhibitor of DNA gyrase (YacG/DUF329 family)
MSDFTSKPRYRCPICGGPSDVAFRPFCSRRCADVDLSRWLRGAYVIPGPAEGGDKVDATQGEQGEAGGETDGGGAIDGDGSRRAKGAERP